MTNSGYCPKCNNPIKKYDNERLTDSYGVKHSFTCENCGFKGYECYETVFYGFEDEDNKTIIE